MSDLGDEQVAQLIEDHLDAYGVRIGSDDVGTTAAIRAVVRTIERTWDLVIPHRVLDRVRDRGELVGACVEHVRRHLRLRARRKPLPDAATLQVRIEPPEGSRAGGITRGGMMTAYDAEELLDGVRRWGPGTRIEVVVADERATAMVDALVDRAGGLRDGTVRVNVKRSAPR